MAVSVLRFSRRACFRSRHTLTRHGYIVLLPEIPNDTPETNPILRQGPIPRLSELTNDKCMGAVGKTIIDLECGLSQLEETLQETDSKKDFESIIIPIEKLTAPLDYAWSTLKSTLAVRHTPTIIELYNNLNPRVIGAQSQRFKSGPLFNALTHVSSASRSRLSEPQRRVVERYLLEARLNGIHLSGSELTHFNSASRHLLKAKTQFRTKVIEATKRFRHLITDSSIVQQFPDDLLREMALDSANPTQGPWTVTLEPRIYEAFMRHCPDRALRWNTWLAYNSRGSIADVKTSLHMEDICLYKHDQAKLLGYSSYADLSMETKMAGSVENVKSVLNSLKAKSKPAMEQGLIELENFALDWGFNGGLEMWDVPYWRYKQRENIYEVNKDQLKNYLPFTHILQSFFNLSSRLFGVSFKDETSHVEVWNEFVKFYKIYDESDNPIASLYLDPYFRQQKIPGVYLELGINRCDSLGIKPSGLMVFNFSTPANGKPSLLSFDEVTILFQKFGTLLQHTLTTAGNSDVAGLTNVEWDAVDICAKFMSFWLTDVRTLSEITSHYESGEKLDEDTCTRFVNARNHLASYDLMREIYLSAFDLEIYSVKEYWLEVMKRLWPEYMPFPLIKQNVHPCSFLQIFSDEYSAAYYSSIWSEMVAADAFSAFQEVGLFNSDEVKVTGRRFRDTFLAMGGGCHPSDTFRRFRGRDPTPDAFLKLKGIDN